MGAALLGFFIGLMVALVEAMFREAWLEVRYGPKELRNVSLGGEPISLGSNQNACTIYAANAPPVAFRYWIKDNAIFCEDVSAKRTANVLPGDRKQVGNIVATVCTAGPVAAVSAVEPKRKSSRAAGGFALRLSDGRVLDLAVGTVLQPSDLPGLHSVPPGGPVATVTPHPTEPAIQGLQNLSHLPWRVHLPNGDSIEVKPGRSVRLVAETGINFGSIEGKIES
jgi:hypothetical protein